MKIQLEALAVLVRKQARSSGEIGVDGEKGTPPTKQRRCSHKGALKRGE